jgi:hypothetical protein
VFVTGNKDFCSVNLSFSFSSGTAYL